VANTDMVVRHGEIRMTSWRCPASESCALNTLFLISYLKSRVSAAPSRRSLQPRRLTAKARLRSP